MNAEGARKLSALAWQDYATDELLEAAAEVAEDLDATLGLYRVLEGEVFRRMAETGSSVIVAGDLTAEREVTLGYRWNAEMVAQLAPDFVEYVPAETVVVPPHYRVKNTTALNNRIKKLGSTAEAKALAAARTIEEKPGKLRFTRAASVDDIFAELEAEAAKASRVDALVAQLEGAAS